MGKDLELKLHIALKAVFDGNTPEPIVPAIPPPPKIPQIPKLPHIEEVNSGEDQSMSNGIWPWPQQEEWSNRDVALKMCIRHFCQDHQVLQEN